MQEKKKLVLQLMELSNPPAWKWFKLYETYDGMSIRRLKEIRGGFALAEKGLKRRKANEPTEQDSVSRS
jgi:hypothetical protein